jgi:hypothetical protein
MEALIISCLHLTDIATRSKTNSGVRLAMFISKLTAYHSNYLEQTKDVRRPSVQKPTANCRTDVSILSPL